MENTQTSQGHKLVHYYTPEEQALEQAVINYADQNLHDRFMLECFETDMEENTINGYYTDGETLVQISYDANANHFSVDEREEDRTWSQIEASIEENEKL